MKKMFLMVAFTLTATVAFAHHGEKEKKEAKQEVQKEQEKQLLDSEGIYCEYTEGDTSAYCFFCNCEKLIKAVKDKAKGVKKIS